MKLIVGLGNPGRQYDNTPHNVGFEAIDLLAQRGQGAWQIERRFEAATCEVTIAGNRLTLMKPLTFMNLSGKSVGAFAQRNGVAPGELLIISDDLHLPLGKIRLRPAGSHGGQKGLLSVIQTLGTMDFPRLRIGVKPAEGTIQNNVTFVLGKIRPADRELYQVAIGDAADAVEVAVKSGLEAAMNRYNAGTS